MAPLPGFSSLAWDVIARDAADLLARHGPELHCLGWTAVDLFGIDPKVLGTVVYHWGLALLLGGARVVELSAAMARIELPSGTRQSFTRRTMLGAVPLWDAGEGA